MPYSLAVSLLKTKNGCTRPWHSRFLSLVTASFPGASASSSLKTLPSPQVLTLASVCPQLAQYPGAARPMQATNSSPESPSKCKHFTSSPPTQWASLGLLRRPNSRCFSRPALGHSGTCSRGSFQSRNQNLSLPFSSCTFCHEVKPKLPAKVFRGATCPSPSPLTFYLLWSSCFSFCSSNTPIIPSSGHCRCAFTSLGPALCTDAPAKGIPPFHTIQPLSSTGSSSCPRFSLLAQMCPCLSLPPLIRMENPSRVSIRGSPLYPHSLGTLLGTEWVLDNRVLMESSPLRLTCNYHKLLGEFSCIVPSVFIHGITVNH